VEIEKDPLPGRAGASRDFEFVTGAGSVLTWLERTRLPDFTSERLFRPSINAGQFHAADMTSEPDPDSRGGIGVYVNAGTIVVERLVVEPVSSEQP
jgi:hypothetical protein